MKKTKKLFADSLHEFQDVRKPAVMAMLLALAVVLGILCYDSDWGFLRIDLHLSQMN